MAANLYKLTTIEETAALLAAHIDPNVDTWDEETLELAGAVLGAAQAAKVERLHFGRKADYVEAQA